MDASIAFSLHTSSTTLDASVDVATPLPPATIIINFLCHDFQFPLSNLSTGCVFTISLNIINEKHNFFPVLSRNLY